MQVARAGNHLDLVFRVADERQVERAAPQVVHENPLLAGQLREPQALRAQDVAQGSRDRFVDDVDLLEPRLASGCDGRQPLPFAELRGDGDDRPFDRADLPLRIGQRASAKSTWRYRGRIDLACRSPIVFFGSPIQRLAFCTTCAEFMIALRRASVPTISSPLSYITTDGVEISPSWLGIETGSPCSLR